MTANRYKYFRWTPRTARITLTYMFLVPGIVGYIAYKTDVSFVHSIHLFSRTIYNIHVLCDLRTEVGGHLLTKDTMFRASTISALSGEVMTCASSKVMGNLLEGCVYMG